MADLALAAQIASIVSAIAASLQLGVSYRDAEATVDKGAMDQYAKILTSTYDDSELAALHARLKVCRDRFINEGDGTQRVRCMCSVLKDAMAGNGGTLPPIPEWGRMYGQLC